MPNSLNDKLLSLGYTPELSLANRKTFSLKENKALYRMVLSRESPVSVFCVDGVIIQSGLRCDKLILVDLSNQVHSWVVLFLELKGTAILHAIEQLRSTISNALFRHPSNKRIYARVVGCSFPSNQSNPSVEKAKIDFWKHYNCELKMLKSNQPDNLTI